MKLLDEIRTLKEDIKSLRKKRIFIVVISREDEDLQLTKIKEDNPNNELLSITVFRIYG